MDLFALSREVEQYVIDMRREFHAHPEISYQEERTAARIREELEATGIPYEIVGSGNVVGILDTGRPGKSLAIRADIDALPMDEENKSLSYCSTVPGVMHSCGHDGHAAMLLGTAKILSRIRDELRGKVYPYGDASESGACQTILWTTSNEAWAQVDETGKVTLLEAGIGKTVTITASAVDGSGKKATFKIRIIAG